MNLLSVSQRKKTTTHYSLLRAAENTVGDLFHTVEPTDIYYLVMENTFLLSYSIVVWIKQELFVFFFDLIEKGHCLFLKHSSSLCRDPWCKSKPSQGQADPRETVPASTDSKQMVFALFHSFWKQELLHILLIIYYFYLQKCVHSYTCCGFNLASEICKM